METLAGILIGIAITVSILAIALVALISYIIKKID